MRGSKEAAEAERRRRLASVAIDFSTIVETASVKAVQPLERVTKQLSGLLDRVMDDAMQFDDDWSRSAPVEEIGEEDRVPLFSKAVLTQSAALAARPDSLVPTRGVADDSKLVVEQVVPSNLVVTRRSEWALQGSEDSSDSSSSSNEVLLSPPVEIEIVEPGAESSPLAVVGEAAEEDVNFFSEKVIAGRQMYKRQRESLPTAVKADREALALLCVDGKTLRDSSGIDHVFVAAEVESLLPGDAVVVPHAGEQPPSPDLPRAVKKPKVHKRWVFGRVREEAIDAMMSTRQRRRHPGLIRKMRSTLPQVRDDERCFRCAQSCCPKDDESEPD